MRLADDERGRVPFALLGVLLLVGSATFSGALSTHDPVADRRVDEAVDRATAQADAAVRAAVGDAAREAAANPVTTPANTTVGRVLSENQTFRDYLRLRIALAASERLRAVSVQRSGVNASVSFPRPTNESSLRAALERVSIDSRENGTVLVATVENISVDVQRGGNRVADELITTTVGVRTPVLALHDRTETFEHRLTAGATNGGTLDATVTTALWAAAWTRGWSQYAGAPIENVVSNDHAALATNAGVLLTEQQTFGTTDADARGAMGRAAVQAGAQSLLSQTGIPAAPELANALPAPNKEADTPPKTVPSNRTINASVGPAADRALVSLLDGRGDGPSFDGVVTDAHSATVSVKSDVRVIEDIDTAPIDLGTEWELVEETTDSDVSVTAVPTRTPALSPDTVVVDTGSRVVTTRETTVRTWSHGNETIQTQEQTKTKTRVDLAVVIDPHSVPGPARPIDPATSTGGVLDGENFAAAVTDAEDVVSTHGGFDGLARDVAAGDVPSSETTVAPQAPKFGAWVRSDLVDLHQRVRNRSETVSARALAAGEMNLAAELAASLRADRRALIDGPAAYDGVSDRARIAVRAAYLDRVLAELDRRANQTAAATGAASDAAQNADVGSLSTAVSAERTARSVLGSKRTNRTTNQTGVRFVPDADPMYLSLSGLSGSAVPTVARDGTYHPLVARNTNLFTLPYGDATDTVLEPIFGAQRRVSLRTAAHALLAADDTLAASNGTNESLENRRDRLETAVIRATRPAQQAAHGVLAEHTNYSLAERQSTIETVFGRWDNPANKALAITNGTAARLIATEVAGTGTVEADILELRLEAAFKSARKNSRSTVPQRLTNRTVETTRTVRQEAVATTTTDAAMRATENAVTNRVNKTLKSRFNRSFKRVPAGMPVASVPGYWYATVNVWDVAVSGEFGQFRVHARGDTESLTYARDGSTVALDWNGNGTAETVGHGERVSFEVETAIVVAVPASGVGVGDVDGNADERSDGWKGGPGCTVPADCREV
ncbi:hypothetical protein E6P09_06595 [Haloferax mediterranei ATCC 33500]|nr:hypothetical protein [Haloferax mediterranei]AFK18433.1 hypothetical protein HFX_0710 [Haloferax mediterranei ATCC 33500]EMA02290.1 hypothetical protein C439_06905 [Haloferax mediterranei ATCC 33500]MDX5988526.1 hypothetical protein [Haloferax mediterranei ATCC 33500]QCQ74942.1 hypothetical protein E6P09_06595 [Haloferax mediterranei ATCC 33500]